MAWFNNQGIPASRPAQDMQQYFSGTDWRSQMQPMSAGWSNTNQAPASYSNYEDMIQNPEGFPNALQNLERFADNRFEGGNEAVPGMGKKAIDYIDAPVNFMMRANHPTRFDPLVNAKNFAQELPGKIKSGITGLLDNTFLGKIAAGTNPLNPNSGNFNPMLQGQLDVYGNYVDETGEDPLEGQNLVSGFGTNDPLAQLRKRLQRIRTRKMDQTDASMAKQAEILRAIKEQTAAENAGYQGTPDGNVGSGAFAKMDQSGKTYGPHGGSGEKMGMAQGRASDRGRARGRGETGQIAGSHHFNQGGYMRRGYSRGGRVGILSVF